MSVECKVVLGASPEKAWATVNDFMGWGVWLPNSGFKKKKKKDGKLQREVKYPDGRILVERLDSVDDAAMTVTYSMTSDSKGPYPLKASRSSFAVSAVGKSRCRITWQTTLEVDKGFINESAAIADWNQLYENAFSRLRPIIEG